MENKRTFGLIPESILDDLCVVCIIIGILGCSAFFGYESYLDYARGKLALAFWDLLGNAAAVLGFGIFAGMFAGTIATVIIAIVCNAFLYAERAVLSAVNHNVTTR